MDSEEDERSNELKLLQKLKAQFPQAVPDAVFLPMPPPPTTVEPSSLRQNLLKRNGRGASPTEAGQLLLQHGRGILTCSDTGPTTNTRRGIHRGFGPVLPDQQDVPIHRPAGIDGDIPTCLHDPVKRASIHHQIFDDGKRTRTPRLNRNDGSVGKPPHVQLTG